MAKIIFLSLLIVGVVLLVYGLNAADSVSSSVTNAVSGAPTDKSIWLIVLGIFGLVSGGTGLILRRSPQVAGAFSLARKQ